MHDGHWREPKAVAAAIGCSTKTVYRWIWTGAVEVKRLPSRRALIKVDGDGHPEGSNRGPR